MSILICFMQLCNCFRTTSVCTLVATVMKHSSRKWCCVILYLTQRWGESPDKSDTMIHNSRSLGRQHTIHHCSVTKYDAMPWQIYCNLLCQCYSPAEKSKITTGQVTSALRYQLQWIPDKSLCWQLESKSVQLCEQNSEAVGGSLSRAHYNTGSEHSGSGEIQTSDTGRISAHTHSFTKDQELTPLYVAHCNILLRCKALNRPVV